MACDVVLVAMPWEMLEFPSIQLGTLEALLTEHGFQVRSRSSKIPFWDHCLAGTAADPPDIRLALGDYDHIALSYWEVGLGDWIFGVPPLRDDPASDAAYTRLLADRGVPESWIRKARRIRSLVPSFLRAERDWILAREPAVVGFTSTFSQNLPSLALARMLADLRPELTIVFGGANCDGPMGEALPRAFPQVDAVVRGEAERVLPALLEELVAGEAPTPRPGLTLRADPGVQSTPEDGGSRVSMDDVPTPVYDEFFETLSASSFHGEVRPFVTLLYESARGCWWGEASTCTFCGLNALGMAFRSKPPERVEAELLGLASRHRRLSFQIVDNILDQGYFDTVLPALARRGHDFGFFVETKSSLTWKRVAVLRDAGVSALQAGLESLDTRILKLMRKGVTALQNVRMLVHSRRAGIHCYWNLIYGFPGEPEEAYEGMARLAPLLSHLQPPTLTRLRVDRFSPYHSDPEGFGIELKGPSPWYPLLYPEVEAALVDDLAYTFEYRLPAEQGDPDAYVKPLREAVDAWIGGQTQAVLQSRGGPGFLLIDDRRTGLEPAHYALGPLGRRIYEACFEGATPEHVRRILAAGGGQAPSRSQIEGFLGDLAGHGLVFEEKGRFLALAVPARAGSGAPGEPAGPGVGPAEVGSATPDASDTAAPSVPADAVRLGI